MRPAILSLSLIALLAACSSDGGGGGGTTTPSHSPNPLEPSDGSAPLPLITISIKGQGVVVSRDDKVHCSSDGTTTTGVCTTYYDTTLFAEHAYGWSFSHWEPVTSNVGNSAALLVTMASPTALTAVFTQD